MISKQKRSMLKTILLCYCVWLIPVYAMAVNIFGKIKVVLDGFQGYNTTLQQNLTINIEGQKTQTQHDGSFRLDTMSIPLAPGQGPLQWAASQQNSVSIELGGIKITIPADWVGWKLSQGRVFLQSVDCFVDAEGGAFCRVGAVPKKQLVRTYALRYGIVDLRTFGDTPAFTPPPSPHIVRPQTPTPPAQPTPIRPTPIKPVPPANRPRPIKPQPIQPRPKVPQEPEIIGPAD